jgi:hypothetical protein
LRVSRVTPKLIDVSIQRQYPTIVGAYAERGDTYAVLVHTRFNLGFDPAGWSDVVSCQRAVDLAENDFLR